MGNPELSFNNVISNYNNLNEEIKLNRSEAEKKLYQLWKENLEGIRSYFLSFQEKFTDEHLSKGYSNAVDDFIRKLRINPQDEFNIQISITILKFYLNKLGDTFISEEDIKNDSTGINR